jgi:hypothetical protein
MSFDDTAVLLANASVMRALIALASKLADRQRDTAKENGPGDTRGRFTSVI